MTLNNARLCPDLIRRSIPINLFCEEDPGTRKFVHQNLKAFAAANRSQLLSEIAGMVIKWINAGKPMDIYPRLATHSTGIEWAKTVDAILRTNGYMGYLTNFDTTSQDCSDEYIELKTLCEKYPDQKLTSTEWLQHCRMNDVFHEQFMNGYSLRNERSAATQIGIIFGRYLGRRFVINETKYLLRKRLSSGTNYYLFEKEIEVEEIVSKEGKVAPATPAPVPAAVETAVETPVETIVDAGNFESEEINFDEIPALCQIMVDVEAKGGR